VLGVRHPFSRALYDREETDGLVLVRVTTPEGAEGWFRPDGQWVRGALQEADPQLCGWVAGPQAASTRVQARPTT
jgi:hypothetical protein